MLALRWLAFLASLLGLVALISWNIHGLSVRDLMDADHAGTLCRLAALQLAACVAAPTGFGLASRFLLGAGAGARVASAAAFVLTLAAVSVTTATEEISSLGFFSRANECAASAAREPVLLGALVLCGLAVVAVPGLAGRVTRPAPQRDG
jgi:hypothetical protein